MAELAKIVIEFLEFYIFKITAIILNHINTIVIQA